MENKKYLDDLRNLKPMGFDSIPKESINKKIKHEIPSKLKEKIIMEPLKSSKTLWGFGIALFIYVIQSVLAAMNIAGPDNLLVKTAVEVVVAIAGFFGVYGIRDALRKINQNL